MPSNKSIREQMIKIYGAECWIEKLQLRPREKYKNHYRSKGEMKRMKQLTYHHIKPKSKGGQATIQNGALLSAENHAWFHRQPPGIQERLNNIFQEYKASCSQFTHDPKIETCVNDYDLFITKARSHYNRAKMKRETQKLVDDEFFGESR